jgi:flagellar L-ring protein precursor FlgH
MLHGVTRRSACRLPLIIAILLVPFAARSVSGQDASLLRRHDGRQPQAPLTLRTGSFLYQEPIPPKVLAKHDIVTVVVNVMSRMASEGEVDNRKETRLDAVLADWIGFDNGDLVPDPQRRGSPTIAGQWKSKYRADAGVESRSSLTFTIAAEIADIRPNGNLVIEARRTIQNNAEVWEQCLRGVIRREDVTPDNKVLSEDIADLRIFKRESGQVRDGYRRGWLVRFFERWQPI